VVIKYNWHDGESDDRARVPEQISNVLVIETNHVLSVDFQQLMVSEQSKNVKIKPTEIIIENIFGTHFLQQRSP
jgi:hypothetical protein